MGGRRTMGGGALGAAGRGSVRKVGISALAGLLLLGAVVALVTRDGGGVTVSTSAESTSIHLPFDQPGAATLQDSDRKVFAHYFTPYPVSIDNRRAGDDYYSDGYLAPDGEDGRHAAYGGFLRDRPLPVPVSDSPDWQMENYEREVRTASDAGIDGFAVDMLSLQGYNWDRLVLLLTAAERSGTGFSIMIMPDATALGGVDGRTLAEAVAGLTRFSSLYRLDDGRLVVSPYSPESYGAPWWSNWVDTMATEFGEEVAFVPCFLDYGANVDAFDAFSYGFGEWGSRSPAANAALPTRIDDAHRRGKIWMQPVSAQDQRPSQGVYDEANNTENLRRTWDTALAGADWVQIATWNDYSEGSQIAPSVDVGWSLLDISSFYINRFKSVRWPVIVRDTVYLSHRTQFVGAVPVDQRDLMRLRAGSSPPRDEVEVMTFLTAPADLWITVGGRQTHVAAPAGVAVFRAELMVGSVSARVVRDDGTTASVTSPFPVQERVEVQDLGYHFVSSRRTDPAMVRATS